MSIKLTPVEKYNSIWFKREDLYNPFPSLGITGSKIRQCLALIKENKKKIIDDFDSCIATAASVHSPQSVIVAQIAKKYKFQCIIGYGGSLSVQEAIQRHRTLNTCHKLGAQIVNLSKLAYSAVLYGRLREWGEKHKRNFFTVRFGFEAELGNATNPVISAIASQVKNIPKDITHIVVPVGSGVNACGVLVGVKKYCPHVKVILIQPFGFDRSGLIKNYGKDYEYIKGKYPYAKKVSYEISPTFHLDEIYESKAFLTMLASKSINVTHDKICFWVIGKCNIY